MKIYFLSDLHLMHDKPFIYKARGYNNVTEMCEDIVRIHNSIVTDEDIVYSLGDEFLNDNDTAVKYLRQMKGNFKFIRGNHTTDTRVELLILMGWEYLGWADVIKYKKYHFYLSHYPTITSNFDIEKPVKARLWNLAGHSHCKNKYKDMQFGCYHVELDAHNNAPISIETIIEDIKFYNSLDKTAQLCLSQNII